MSDQQHWECGHRPRCADAACSYNPSFRSIVQNGRDLDDLIAEEMEDPEFRRAFEALDRWNAEAVRYICPRGCCVSFVHPTDDSNQSGWGPVGCPHADDESAAVRATWTPAGETD